MMMKKKTDQMVKEELQKQAAKADFADAGNKPHVVLGRPTLDPAYQERIKRRRRRRNQPYVPPLDHLDTPPLLNTFLWDRESQN